MRARRGAAIEDGELLLGRPSWIVLTVSLLLTATAWLATRRSVAAYDAARFATLTAALERNIDQRMQTYVSTLVQAKAALETRRTEINRAEFKRYVERLELFRQYPGIQGVGYALRIPPGKLAAHEAAVRAEGFPGYRVWPEGPRPDYFSIVFLEPFDWRNQRAFGYDMFSDPIRHEAMLRAMLTGQPASTERVTLVQETNERPQAGFLVYVPVYERGRPVDTAEERRDALVGFVYAPFRADDFFRAATRGTVGEPPAVDFEVYVGPIPTSESLLHDHDGIRHAGDPTFHPRFERVTSLAVAGQVWTIDFVSLPAFEVSSLQLASWAVLLAGLVFSLLLHRLFVSNRREAAAGVIRRSEEKLRSILENLPVGVVTTDERGRRTRTNPKFREIWAEQGEPAPGDCKGWWGDTGKPLEDQDWPLARVLASGEAVLGEVVDIEAFDGRRKTILSGAIPLQEGDRLTGAMVVVQDITELRKAEETRAQLIRETAARLEAEQGLRTRDEFLSIASHELKTPLSSLRLHSQMFQRGLRNLDPKILAPERITRLVDLVDRQTARLNRLVEDMLDVSRIHSGSLSLKKEPVELGELIREIVERLSPVMVEAGTPPGFVCLEPVEGCWDRFRIEQVATNLLTNAMRYGGRKPVLVQVERRGGFARLGVRDRGLGIPAEDLDRVFGRFERAVSASEVSGLGLGLFISRQIVDAHGGRIWVESEGPGKGSTFVVELPASGPGDSCG
jgi:signal transduction histidine kinase